MSSVFSLSLKDVKAINDSPEVTSKDFISKRTSTVEYVMGGGASSGASASGAYAIRNHAFNGSPQSGEFAIRNHAFAA